MPNEKLHNFYIRALLIYIAFIGQRSYMSSNRIRNQYTSSVQTGVVVTENITLNILFY